MFTGASVLLVGVAAANLMTYGEVASAAVTAPIWLIIGAGMALIITPTGRVIRSSAPSSDLPAAFAAQFSLSHLAWLIAYPVAGVVGTRAGLPVAWTILGALAAIGAVAAVSLWPRDRAVVDHSRAPSAGALTGALTLHAGQCSCVRPA